MPPTVGAVHHLERRADHGALRLLAPPHLLQPQRVAGERDRLAGLDRRLVLGAKRRRRGDAERDEDDAEVRDVAAVAVPVAADEPHQRRRPPFAVRGVPRAHADPVLAQVRERRVPGEREREQRVRRSARRRRARRPSSSRAPAAGGRSFDFSSAVDAAFHGSAGPTPIRKSSVTTIGSDIRLKNGSPTLTFTPLHRLCHERKERAREHREHERGEEQVVQQEHRLARRGRIEAPRAAQPLGVSGHQHERRRPSRPR